MKKAYLFTAIFMASGALHAMEGEPCPDLESVSYTPEQIEDHVFNAAPPAGQQLVTYFKGGMVLEGPDVNGVLLTGRPGTGKTAFTKALARKAGKSLIVIHPQEVLGENRWETDINLKHRLDDITQNTRNALIVCDKMDEMFLRYCFTREQLDMIREEDRDSFSDRISNWLFGEEPKEKRRYEPKEALFCEWFNTVPADKKLFFIGVAREREALPSAFKHKMANQMYHFSSHPNQKAATLLWYLGAYKSIDESVSKELLSQSFSYYARKRAMYESGGFNGHDMKALADRAKRYASLTQNGILTIDAVDRSFDNLYAERMRNGYYGDDD